MNFKDLFIVLQNNKTSTKKKLLSYCRFFKENSGETEIKGEIDQIFPKFKLYTDTYPKLILACDKFGEFTYNVNRLDYLISENKGRLNDLKGYINNKVLSYVHYGEILDQKKLDSIFTNINSPKYCILPGDINILIDPNMFFSHIVYVDNNYILSKELWIRN